MLGFRLCSGRALFASYFVLVEQGVGVSGKRPGEWVDYRLTKRWRVVPPALEPVLEREFSPRFLGGGGFCLVVTGRLWTTRGLWTSWRPGPETRQVSRRPSFLRAV